MSRLKARGSFLGAPWKCMHVAVFAGLERDVIDHRLVKIRPETFAEFSGIRHRVSPPRKRARSARAEIPLTNSTTAGNASRRDSGYRVCTSFPKPGTRLILYRRCVSSQSPRAERILKTNISEFFLLNGFRKVIQRIFLFDSKRKEKRKIFEL